MAVYRENLAGTRIEVTGGTPPEATHLVMDKDSPSCTSTD
jgi:hypothetical protein